jgi:hypothetical protein
VAASLFAVIGLWAGSVQSAVWYASPQPAGSGSGGGWADATTLQGAMEKAVAGDQIWVMQGTYVPTRYNFYDEATHGNDSRHLHFAPRNGVEIYGGFVGSETDLSRRDWRSHPTILSGDLGSGQKVYHVVVNGSPSPGPGTILDGLVIANGDAMGAEGYDGYGGGMLSIGENVNPLVRNCVFRGNHAMKGGGAFLADIGAGATFINCIFHDNVSDGIGGALGLLAHCDAKIGGCLFFGNAASFGGAILADSAHVTLSIRNCTITGNTSKDAAGGGIAVLGPRAAIASAILWGNVPDGVFDRDSTVQVAHSNVQGGFAGIANLAVDPQFEDPAGNIYRLQKGSPCIDVGDNDRVPKTLGVDLEGNPRIADGGRGAPVVDHGAFEFHPPSR